jgi:hypothetical protein
LNGTHGTGGFGGAAAAPVFQAVASEALRVLDIPKDLPDEPPAKVAAAKPGDANDLAVADLAAGETNILEDADDEDAPHPAPLPLAPGTRMAPNFNGKTLRAVLAEAEAGGYAVLPDGSGTARAQSPAAGAVLHEGERIRVRFAR